MDAWNVNGNKHLQTLILFWCRTSQVIHMSSLHMMPISSHNIKLINKPPTSSGLLNVCIGFRLAVEGKKS